MPIATRDTRVTTARARRAEWGMEKPEGLKVKRDLVGVSNGGIGGGVGGDGPKGLGVGGGGPKGL